MQDYFVINDGKEMLCLSPGLYPMRPIVFLQTSSNSLNLVFPCMFNTTLRSFVSCLAFPPPVKYRPCVRFLDLGCYPVDPSPHDRFAPPALYIASYRGVPGSPTSATSWVYELAPRYLELILHKEVPITAADGIPIRYEP